MLQRFRAAGLVWPTVLALPVLGLLIGLGTWQLQRMAWKDGLLRQIRERVVAPPVDIGRHLMAAGQIPSGIEYLRVRVRGRFLHGQERHIYWPSSAGPGALVVTPLVLADGMVVLVNRGWVPDALTSPERRREGLIAGEAEVVGLVRTPEPPGRFTPANDPARNIWFWRDVPAMLACRGGQDDGACKALTGVVAGGQVQRAYPFVIDAEATPANPGGWPRGGTTSLELPNRHMEYAGTWYGLALTLVGVYIAFVVSRLRKMPGGVREVGHGDGEA